MQLKIRDRYYEASDMKGLKLVPLASVLGMDSKGRPIDLKAMNARDQNAYAELVLQRLSEPSNHHRIAYSLKAVIPDIDPLLVSYELNILPNGARQELATLDLELDDLLEIFAQLQEGMEAAQPEQREKPKVDRPTPKHPAIAGSRRR